MPPVPKSYLQVFVQMMVLPIFMVGFRPPKPWGLRRRPPVQQSYMQVFVQMMVLHLFLASGFRPPKPWGRRRRKASGTEVLSESLRPNDCASPLPCRIPSPDTMGPPPQASGQTVLSASLRPNDGASNFPGFWLPSTETMGPPPQGGLRSRNLI